MAVVDGLDSEPGDIGKVLGGEKAFHAINLFMPEHTGEQYRSGQEKLTAIRLKPRLGVRVTNGGFTQSCAQTSFGHSVHHLIEQAWGFYTKNAPAYLQLRCLSLYAFWQNCIILHTYPCNHIFLSHKMKKLSFRYLLALSGLLSILLLNGCASVYVDTALKDVKPEEISKPISPRDAQLVFEFRSKGTANASATAHLKDQVTALVVESGLFKNVAGSPQSDGALLSVVIDNVPLTDDAFSQGFVSGLTFGLVGSAVTDGYVCTIEYLPPGEQAPISTTVRHAIHTTIGAKGAPVNVAPAASVDEAVRTMTRQVVLNGLKQLATDKSFTTRELK